MVAGSQCHRGRNATTGTVAGDDQARGVDAEVLGMCDHPLGGGERIIELCGGRVLRGQPVVDGYHDRPGCGGQSPGQRLEGLVAAHHQTAAVKVQHHRRRVVAHLRRPVDAYRDLPCRRRYQSVDHFGHIWHIGWQRR